MIDLGRNYLYTRRIGLAENREASFVAPEIRGDSNGTFTDTSDLYSFGMILIELADPQGVQGETIPDSLYQYAPALARFVEDLVDVNPDKRLLIFSQDRKDLLSAFVDELDVLPSDSEVKPWLPFRLWGRQIEIKPKVHFWVQQIRDLFFPSSQLALLRKLWRLNQSPKHTEIAKYSGRLYRWLIFCTIHWNLIFLFCITLGLFRDFGVGDFSAPMSFAQRYIFHCNNCVPVIDWLGAPGYRFNNVLAVLPARLTIFSVIAQTKYYQNILAGLTVKPIKSRLASFTEITLRGSAICSLIPILYCNLYQPSSWLIMLVLGYLTVGINNILCYQLAICSLNEAKRKLSTVPRSDDPVLEAFETWGQNMIVYMVLLLAIWLGLQTGFLHDEWIYVIGTVGVSIFVWIISKCIKLGASLRGSLSRAFIAGERLEAIP